MEDSIFLILDSGSDCSSDEFIVIDEVGCDSTNTYCNQNGHTVGGQKHLAQRGSDKLRHRTGLGKLLEIHLQKIDINEYGGNVSRSRYLAQKSFEETKRKRMRREEKRRRERERRKLQKLMMCGENSESSCSQLKVEDRKRPRTEDRQLGGTCKKSPFSFTDGFKIPQKSKGVRSSTFESSANVEDNEKSGFHIKERSSHSLKKRRASQKRHYEPLCPPPKKLSQPMAPEKAHAGLRNFKQRHRNHERIKHPSGKDQISKSNDVGLFSQVPKMALASKCVKKRKLFVPPENVSSYILRGAESKLKKPKNAPLAELSVSDKPRSIVGDRRVNVASFSPPSWSPNSRKKKGVGGAENLASNFPAMTSFKQKKIQESAKKKPVLRIAKPKSLVKKDTTVQLPSSVSPQKRHDVSQESCKGKANQIVKSARKEKHRQSNAWKTNKEFFEEKLKVPESAEFETNKNKNSNSGQDEGTANFYATSDLNSVQSDKDSTSIAALHEEEVEAAVTKDSAYHLRLLESIRTLQGTIEASNEVEDLVDIPIVCGEFKNVEESPLKDKPQKQNDVVDTPSVHLQCGDTMCKEVTLIGENKPADRNDITTEVDQEGEKSDMLSRCLHQSNGEPLDLKSRKRVKIADEAVIISDDFDSLKSASRSDPPFFIPKSVLKNSVGDPPPLKKKKCFSKPKHHLKKGKRKSFKQHITWNRKRKGKLEQQDFNMRSSEVAPKKEEPHSIRQRAPSLKMVESIQNEDIFRRNRRKQAIKLLEVSREDALNSSKMSERLSAVKRREYIIERRTQNKSRKDELLQRGNSRDVFHKELVRYHPSTDCRRSWRERRDNPVIQSRGCQTGKGADDEPLSIKTSFYLDFTPLYYRGMRGPVPVSHVCTQAPSIQEVEECPIKTKKFEYFIPPEQVWLLLNPVDMDTSSRCVPLCSELYKTIQKRNRNGCLKKDSPSNGGSHLVFVKLLLLFSKRHELESLSLDYPHNLCVNYLITALRTLGDHPRNWKSLATVMEYANCSKGFTFYMLGFLVMQIDSILLEIYDLNNLPPIFKKAIEMSMLMSLYVRQYLRSKFELPKSSFLKLLIQQKSQALKCISKPEHPINTTEVETAFSVHLQKCKENITEAERKLQSAIKHQFEFLEHFALESQLSSSENSDSESDFNESTSSSARTTWGTFIPRRNNPERTLQTMKAKTALINSFFHLESFLPINEFPGTVVEFFNPNSLRDKTVADIIDSKLQSMIDRYTERTNTPPTVEKKDKMRSILLLYYMKHIQSLLSENRSIVSTTANCTTSNVPAATLSCVRKNTTDFSPAVSRTNTMRHVPVVPSSKCITPFACPSSEMVTGRVDLSVARHANSFTSISQMISKGASPFQSSNLASEAHKVKPQVAEPLGNGITSHDDITSCPAEKELPTNRVLQHISDKETHISKQQLNLDSSCANSFAVATPLISSPFQSSVSSTSSTILSSSKVLVPCRPVRPDSVLRVKFQPSIPSLGPSFSTNSSVISSLPSSSYHETALSLLKKTLDTAENIYPRILQSNLAKTSPPYIHGSAGTLKHMIHQQNRVLAGNETPVSSCKQRYTSVSLLQNSAPNCNYVHAYTIPRSVSSGPQCRPTASVSGNCASSTDRNSVFDISSLPSCSFSSPAHKWSAEPPMKVLIVPNSNSVSKDNVNSRLLPVYTSTSVTQTSLPVTTSLSSCVLQPSSTVTTSLPVSTTPSSCMLQPSSTITTSSVSHLQALFLATSPLCATATTRSSLENTSVPNKKCEVHPPCLVSKSTPLHSVCSSSHLTKCTGGNAPCSSGRYTSASIHQGEASKSVSTTFSPTSILSSEDVHNIVRMNQAASSKAASTISSSHVLSSKELGNILATNQSTTSVPVSMVSSSTILSSKEVENIMAIHRVTYLLKNAFLAFPATSVTFTISQAAPSKTVSTTTLFHPPRPLTATKNISATNQAATSSSSSILTSNEVENIMALKSNKSAKTSSTSLVSNTLYPFTTNVTSCQGSGTNTHSTLLSSLSPRLMPHSYPESQILTSVPTLSVDNSSSHISRPIQRLKTIFTSDCTTLKPILCSSLSDSVPSASDSTVIKPFVSSSISCLVPRTSCSLSVSKPLKHNGYTSASDQVSTAAHSSSVSTNSKPSVSTVVSNEVCNVHCSVSYKETLMPTLGTSKSYPLSSACCSITNNASLKPLLSTSVSEQPPSTSTIHSLGTKYKPVYSMPTAREVAICSCSSVYQASNITGTQAVGNNSTTSVHSQCSPSKSHSYVVSNCILNEPVKNGVNVPCTSDSILPTGLQSHVSSTLPRENCNNHLQSDVQRSQVSKKSCFSFSSTETLTDGVRTTCVSSSSKDSYKMLTSTFTHSAKVHTPPAALESMSSCCPSDNKSSSSSNLVEIHLPEKTIVTSHIGQCNGYERAKKQLFNSKWHKVNPVLSNQVGEALGASVTKSPSDTASSGMCKEVLQSKERSINVIASSSQPTSSGMSKEVLQSKERSINVIASSSQPTSSGMSKEVLQLKERSINVISSSSQPTPSPSSEVYSSPSDDAVSPCVLECKFVFDAKIRGASLQLKWNLSKQDENLEKHIEVFEICYARLPNASSFTVNGCCNATWSSMGAIKALPLPMSATLTNLQSSQSYVFIIKGILFGGKKTMYSDIKLVEIDKN